ncbi:hypothetical protein [Rubrivirga marina]|uniref:Uncharacterized protein n=1 Tax=Rubrivirga marina TaxID=1196024 RepID=A0A271IX05_9BACT|nr:hypothetical protein [Rubrivirga marina]PAP75637.1 hypothetical protein BSZ37_03895 [Rubrivirga marina]
MDAVNACNRGIGKRALAVWGSEVTPGSYAGTWYLSGAADGGLGGDDYISYTYTETGALTCDSPGSTLDAFVLYRGQVRVR